MQLSEIQESLMGQPEVEVFSQEGRDSLRCVIRLVVEFYEYLLRYDSVPGIQNSQSRRFSDLLHDDEELRYRVDSVFSGIPSFVDVDSTYKVLKGAKESRLDREEISLSLLAGLYIRKFHHFIQTSTFEARCRLLLDLFRLQIVFAGMVYV